MGLSTPELPLPCPIGGPPPVPGLPFVPDAPFQPLPGQIPPAPWEPWQPLQPFQPENPYDPAPPGTPANERKLFPNPDRTITWDGRRSVEGSTSYQVTGGTVTYNSASGTVGFATFQVISRNSWIGGPGTVATVTIENYSAPVLRVKQNGVETIFDFIVVERYGQLVSLPIMAVNVIITANPVSSGPTEPIPAISPYIADPSFPVPETKPAESPKWPPFIPAPLPHTPAPLPASPDPSRAPTPKPATPAPAPGEPEPEPQPTPAPTQPGPYRPADSSVLEQIKRANALVPLIRPSPRGPTIQEPEPLAEEQRIDNAKKAPAVPARVTPPDARRYGSKTITSGAPRVDPQSLAEEVGRLEQKLGIMLQGMDSTPDWLDALTGQLINRLVTELLDALVVDVPATTYDFVAPCDKDENGDPIEWSAEIEAADYQPAMVARLDAIAEALGILKGWKQPLCRATPPRSNVTVTAYEYDPEA